MGGVEPTRYALFGAFTVAARPLARARVLSFEALKGIRYLLRNYTALAVKEHLRSQVERAGNGAELTPNEVELVRFAADRTEELADRSPGT